MIDFDKYMQLSLDNRKDHIDLDTPCQVYGKERRVYIYRKSLAEYLETGLPKGREIHACHACNNKLCKNPRHLYWGSPEENRKDLENMFIETYGADGIKYLDGYVNYIKMARLVRYAEMVKKGQVHEIIIDESRKIPSQVRGGFVFDGKVIQVEIPEGKKYFHAKYQIRKSKHPLAKDKKYCTNTRTEDFHTACVTAYMLHSSDRYGKSTTSLEAENFIVKYFNRVNNGRIL